MIIEFEHKGKLIEAEIFTVFDKGVREKVVGLVFQDGKLIEPDMELTKIIEQTREQ